MKKTAELDLRLRVTEYQKNGHGPLALATAMLLGAEPRPTQACMYVCGNGHGPSMVDWASPERAAVAWCIINKIPLDMDAHS